MKKIHRNQKNSFFILALVLTCVTSLAIFVQSCSSDEDELDSDYISITTKYLDIDVMSNTEFTPEEMKILVSAIGRASEYLVFDGEKYVFELESPNQINISDRLFEYIYPSMQNIQAGTTDVPRLKFDNEFESGFGYNRHTMNLSHRESLDYYQTMSSGNNYTFAAASIGAGLASTGAGVVLAVAGLVNGEIISSKYNDYVNSGSKKGITIIVTNTFVPNVPGCNLQTTQIINNK